MNLSSDENTKRVRRAGSDATSLDRLDRMLLTALAEDAGQTYAELGRLLHISAPAVHERAKRLKAGGVIRGIVARLDPARIGRPLLAFIHVDTGGWGKDTQVSALRDLPEVEEIHSVTGETCMLLKVRTQDTQALEDLLRRVYAIEGVRGTKSQVVLSTALERGSKPG